MKKALIIGGAGFVGQYLADYLHDACGYQVRSTKMKQESLPDVSYEVVDMNLLAKEEVEEVIRLFEPDYIFHLAAQSSVAVSWSDAVIITSAPNDSAASLIFSESVAT